jgi:hypothetical protein
MNFRESLNAKLEQQKQKAESEYSARYIAEQRTLSLEQALNSQELKFDEISRKYMVEIENVNRNRLIFFLLFKIKDLKDILVDFFFFLIYALFFFKYLFS